MLWRFRDRHPRSVVWGMTVGTSERLFVTTVTPETNARGRAFQKETFPPHTDKRC